MSGLAAGVDSASHQGTLDRGGSTIGVLASGPQSPVDTGTREFRRCLRRFTVRSNGTMVSPRAMQLNSTIAAPSDNVVIVAAGESGGSWEMGQSVSNEQTSIRIDTDHEGAPGIGVSSHSEEQQSISTP